MSTVIGSLVRLPESRYDVTIHPELTVGKI